MVGASVARQNLQLQIHTATLATQAESLLKLLSELRYNLLFSDPDAVSKEVNETIATCRQLGFMTQDSITTLRKNVENAIHQVEFALLPPSMTYGHE